MVPPLRALLPVGLDISPSFGNEAMTPGSPEAAGATGGATRTAGNPAENAQRVGVDGFHPEEAFATEPDGQHLEGLGDELG